MTVRFRFKSQRIAAVVLVGFMLVVSVACGGGGGASQTPEESKRVTLGHIPQWTATTLVNAVGKAVLEEFGYEVEFEEAEIGIIYQGTAMGDIDLFLDSWLPAQQEHWDAWGDQMEQLGVVYEGAVIGWVVPEYVAGVESVEDLPAHVAQFDSDGNGLGEVLSYGAGSGASVVSQQVIEAYDLPFEVVDSSTTALLAEMQARLNRQEPFLGIGWRPHWMFNVWPLRFLDDPKGLWEASTVYVVARKGFSEANPELAAIFEQFEIPLEEFEAMTYAYNVEERDPDEIARQWVEEHRDRIDAWIAAVRGQ